MSWGSTVKIVGAAAICAVMIALVPSCSTAPAAPACSAANCTGCCDGDSCHTGISQNLTLCGAGGAQCAACLPGQRCNTGKCEKDPNAPRIHFPDAGEIGTCGHRGQACCGTGAGCIAG